MASFPELVKMFNEGKLCELLAMAFKGKASFLSPNKDSDFFISFPGFEEMPTSEKLEKVIITYYQAQGYMVGPGMFERTKDTVFLQITHKDAKDKGALVIVNITLFIEVGNIRNNMRATCDIIC